MGTIHAGKKTGLHVEPSRARLLFRKTNRTRAGSIKPIAA